MYDLLLVEPGPLPPHERTWRHPSELGPTRADVDTGPRSGVGVLAAGAFAVLAVAAMVVVMTPRPSSSPVAISVTTSPLAAAVTVVDIDAAQAATVRSKRPSAVRPTTNALLSSFAAYPHAVMSAPQPGLDNVQVADHRPTNGDTVFVRTDDVTYRLAWSMLPMIDVPDGSVVFDASGAIVGRISGGDLRLAVVD